MATDYAEMEREFLAGLEADTGHDLAGWMALIDQQNLAHRNDIIDWLRAKRFTFAWASWLERIHHNGGQPIYGGHPPPVIATAPRDAPAPRPTRAQPALASIAASSPPVATPAPAPENHEALAALLAKAKAYRPLAEHLLREVRKAIPGIAVTVQDGAVSLGRPVAFAILAISPRELRLGLDLGEDAGTTSMPRGRLPGPLAGISHVIVLTDARQIDAALLSAVRQADRRVNG